ncbi:hypothetical protein N7539_002641 [Penicillium diatomitis]|uniref:Uncharacterized protein n=1 Tax=Penicillium diatomitis TaxID=2819901 RepID=A0A9W9XF70_9EURO|nr:uncharacterized protein N7539_002641 [Penicillium diatomitis]KAJ5491074.1 hypothetical protein N7539_002641 [Penicillium diatomitis]
MSTKPIFVATHPRACSTAFERVFMTQRDTIQCVHEPFGDAFYFGPERLSDRFEDDQQARIDSGFSESTYATIMERLEKEQSELGEASVMSYVMSCPISPRRGVGTETKGTGHGHELAEGVNGSTNGTTHTNGDTAAPTNGVVNGDSKSVDNTNGHTTNGTTNGTSHRPYPYDTPVEPGNPTVMPREIQERFHFAFLIRDPHFSVPSYYRCTIPPLDDVTGFHNYDPQEAGYSELRRHFDYLVREGLVGPRVATRPDLTVEHCGAKETVHEICLIDADDMLDAPAATIEAFCNSVGIPYDPSLLTWDTPEDYEFACHCFEKWRGFHNDAIESKALVARTHKKAPKTEDEFDAEWTKKYGPEAAALIRKAVDENMEDYLYLKQFAVKV